MNWIKLADQKPPERVVVVFYNQSTLQPVVGYWANDRANYLQSWLINPHGDTLPWDLNGSLKELMPYGCSHWFPLPSSPA